MEDFYYRIVRLMRDYLCGKIAPAEAEELEKWTENDPKGQKFRNSFRQDELEKRAAFFREVHVRPAFRRFEKRVVPPGRLFMRRLGRYAALWIVPLCIAFLILKSGPFPSFEQPQETEKITPGSYQALLTLSDGKSVPLNQETMQELLLPGPVLTTGEGIIYADTPAIALTTVYNRLATPRGGEYHITLSDGSRIYLNAASALKYPVVFGKGKREVYLTGEAWFEIATDSLRPFYVVTEATRIRVYGTVFNVNTHLRDKVQTVLIQGQIGITGKKEGKEYRMYPSELSEFNAAGMLIGLRKVDTEPYIAWKSGKFLFENKRLEEILDDLSLWYDVDVFYTRQTLKEQRFTGNLRRYEQIGVILDAIHRITGVNFRIQGKTITVSE